jgi:activator of 2-hydroxyglutaryl-CoA dehydratase
MGRRELFAGIDVGSMTTKCVIMDNSNMLASTVIYTDAEPKKAGLAAIESSLCMIGADIKDISYAAGTGYGRISLDFFDHTATEITCHATGVRHVNSEVEGIIV